MTYLKDLVSVLSRASMPAIMLLMLYGFYLYSERWDRQIDHLNQNVEELNLNIIRLEYTVRHLHNISVAEPHKPIAPQPTLTE